MKITRQSRRQQLLLQRQAIIIGQSFGKKLLKKRLELVKRVIKDLDKIPVSKWPSHAPTLLNEPYLNEMFSKLYLSIGLPVGKETINNFLGRKSESMWEQAISRWISKNAGRKVVTINDTFKAWFKGELETVLSLTDNGRLSVEEMTVLLEDRLKNQIPDILNYQVRRIVQTESLTALSVGANESVKELGIGYTKTWGITGNNTRPAHAEMDGVTIDESELFIVDGEQMEFPRDDSYGASAGNIINCSCFVIYNPK